MDRPAIRFSPHLLVSAAFSLILSAAVIAGAGYFETVGLLLFQVLFIAGPTLIPFLFLPKQGRVAIGGWVVIACLLVGGWSFVVYTDTRPYQGGGASFAILFGWLTCFIASVLAAVIALVTRFGARR